MTDVMPEQLVDLDEVGGGGPVTPSSEALDAVDEQLIAGLAGKAREGGLALTGEGGLLAQLTKRLVESGLDGEITDHLGTTSMTPRAVMAGTPATGTGPRRC